MEAKATCTMETVVLETKNTFFCKAMCTDCKPAYMYRGERDIVMSVMMQQISMMPDFDISINTRLIKRNPVEFQIPFNAFDYIFSNIYAGKLIRSLLVNLWFWFWCQ